MLCMLKNTWLAACTSEREKATAEKDKGKRVSLKICAPDFNLQKKTGQWWNFTAVALASKFSLRHLCHFGTKGEKEKVRLCDGLEGWHGGGEGGSTRRNIYN